MARLPRLVLPGLVHHVVQRAHSARPAFSDEEDRQAYLGALRDAAASHRVLVHAYALHDTELQLLATPPDALALSRTLQTVGRRYVSAYNRRHGCSGTLWDGRFRCGVVEPGAWTLNAMQLVDGSAGFTSAGHRSGGAREALLTDPPEYWQLGNTPFDREARWRERLGQGLPAATTRGLREAALGGWAVGSDAFLRQLAEATTRPLRPRPRGRPALKAA